MVIDFRIELGFVERREQRQVAVRNLAVQRSLAAMAEEIEPGEFELKRLEREAEGLLKINAAAGYTVLGAVASLRGDVEEVHARHRHALQLSGESPRTLHNYAASLVTLGDVTGALEVAHRAYARAPADADMFAGVVSTSILTGHFREAFDLVGAWNGSNPERPCAPDSPVEAILSAIDRDVFTEERLQEVLAIAHETLRSWKVRVSRVEVHADQHDPDSFLFECFVAASPEKAEDLNEALDAKIRDCPYLMDDPGLKFMPAFIGASVDGSQPKAAT